MVPSDLQPFMIACLGASASFIGLLFVGLSVVLQRLEVEGKLADTDRILAESSYAALINIFFVALSGILPNESIGYVCLIMALIGLLSCFRLLHYSHVASLTISSIVYVVEVVFAGFLIHSPNKDLNVSAFQGIIIALFAISLVRAWGLTGIRSDDHRRDSDKKKSKS